MRSSKSIKLTLALVSLLLFCVPVFAQRAVLTVTTLADTDDQVCDANCSLRDALFAANPFDTIVFAREIRGGAIELTSPVIITRSVFIDGPNKRRITLKGNNTFRILEIHAFAGIDGLIIRDGNALDKEGGGIFSNHTVNLTNCAILNNSAWRGGGIYMINGSLRLVDTTVAGNTAYAENSAGGMDLFQTMTKIFNSTISGNRLLSKVDGAGGIRLTNSAVWSIIGSTIAFNSTNATSPASAGGLVVLNGFPGPLQNTILAKNTGGFADFFGRFSGARGILMGIAYPFAGLTNGVDGNIVGTPDAPVDPQIYPLLDNGGGILTHALRPRSPAVDAGSNLFSTDSHGDPQALDQRGFSRPVNSTVDIGAFEANSWAVPVTSTIEGITRTGEGRGVFKSRITLNDSTGAIRTILTHPFGFYRLPGLVPDRFYTLDCFDKRSVFVSQSVFVEELKEYVDFRAVDAGPNRPVRH
jgi:CSLREA domain-containing protein